MTADATLPQPLETPRLWHHLALAFAIVLPTATTVVYFVLLGGDKAMGPAYGASKILQAAFPLVWVIAVQRRPIRPARPRLGDVALGLAMGGLMVAAGLAAYFLLFKGSPWLAGLPEEIGKRLEGMRLLALDPGQEISDSSPGRFLAFALFLAGPHALFEEYYWRWFVFGQLRRVAPLWMSVTLSSLGFMAHHVLVLNSFLPGVWQATMLFSLCVAVGGTAWAWIYHRTGSLYGPWASHLLVDAGIMFIGYDLIWRSA